MKELIGSWIGKSVLVNLHSAVSTRLEGELLKVNESGILLDLEHGETFVPMTAVLHISLK